VAYTVGGTRQKLSMIATVTNRGKARWMISDEAFSSDKLIEFLQALIKDAGKKVFLIMDNLRVHHRKPVKAWVAEREDKIELFYLPSYSPGIEPGRMAQCRPQIRHRIKGADPHQGQAESCGNRAHAGIGTNAGTRQKVLSGSTREIRRMKIMKLQTSPGRINNEPGCFTMSSVRPELRLLVGVKERSPGRPAHFGIAPPQNLLPTLILCGFQGCADLTLVKYPG
jgi:hypothetical protein